MLDTLRMDMMWLQRKKQPGVLPPGCISSSTATIGGWFGCRGWNRTTDHLVMSQASYRCSTLQKLH